MGRITQFLDYINREPGKFSMELIKGCYTHFSIKEETKKLRKELKKHNKN